MGDSRQGVKIFAGGGGGGTTHAVESVIVYCALKVVNDQQR